MLRVCLSNVRSIPGVEGCVRSGAVHELVVLLASALLSLLLPSEGVLVGVGIGALREVVLLELWVALTTGTCGVWSGVPGVGAGPTARSDPVLALMEVHLLLNLLSLLL